MHLKYLFHSFKCYCSSFYSGQYEIPVSKLKPPSDELKIREIDREFVNTIKTEMLNCPLISRNPIICMVDTIKSSNLFDPDKIHQYEYHTIGGNHRRLAYQELVEEGKISGLTLVSTTLVFGKNNFIISYSRVIEIAFKLLNLICYS